MAGREWAKEIQEVLDLIEKRNQSIKRIKSWPQDTHKVAQKRSMPGYLALKQWHLILGRWVLGETPQCVHNSQTESDIISIESSQYACCVVRKGWMETVDGNKPSAHSTYPGSTEIDPITVNVQMQNRAATGKVKNRNS